MTVPVEMLLELIPTLQPRSFSIASSQHAHPTQVHLCVAVVEYTTPYNRQKQVCIATVSMQSPSAAMLIVLAFHNQGVCSSWLSALVPGKSVIPLWWVLYADTCPPRRAYCHVCVCVCVCVYRRGAGTTSSTQSHGGCTCGCSSWVRQWCTNEAWVTTKARWASNVRVAFAPALGGDTWPVLAVPHR